MAKKSTTYKRPKLTKAAPLIPKSTIKPVSPIGPDHTLDRFDLSNQWVQERIHWFAVDTTEKILRNMEEMSIYPHRHVPAEYADKFTGRLERSIHFTIVNNAQGDAALVEFYYLAYGRFLELSASGWLDRRKHKPIRKGMVPAMTDKKGVQVGARPWRAKPFISSEIRRQAKKVIGRMARQFAYRGGQMIFNSFVPAKGLKDHSIFKKPVGYNEAGQDFWDFVDSVYKGSALDF